MGKDIIRAESVVKILGNNVVLYDASIEVEKGEIFGVIGPSGSGKTTLLRLLIGFFKPEKGDVLIRSTSIPGRQHELYTSVPNNLDVVKRVFGFASQTPSVYTNLTVQENIAYFGYLHNLTQEEINKTGTILLKLMELEAAQNTLAKHLSGGMQRRLDLACAMIHKPKILILDEPTADLDPFLRTHIWDIIRRINEQGTTIIVSSHILADVEQLCDRVCIVHKGKVIATDTPENIKKQFIDTEHIRVQTYPGKYTKLIKKLKHKTIQDVHEEGQELVITTKNAEKALPVVVKAIQEAKESLTSINVDRSSLDRVFMKLAEEDA